MKKATLTDAQREQLMKNEFCYGTKYVYALDNTGVYRVLWKEYTRVKGYYNVYQAATLCDSCEYIGEI